MSKELTETVKELMILGWSEEGAQGYTDLIKNNGLDFFSSDQYDLPLILFLLFLILIIFISTVLHLSKARKTSLPKENPKSVDSLGSKYNLSGKPPFTNQKKPGLNPVGEVGEKLNSLPIVNSSNIKQLIKAIEPLKENRQKLVQAIEPLRENGQKLVQAIVPLKENGAITPKTIRKVSISNLNSNLGKLFRETSIDLDKTAEIFILTFIIIYDLSIELIQVSIKSLLKKTNTSINPIEKITSNNQTRSNDIEDGGNVSGEELLKRLSRPQLINLINSNPSTLKKLNFKEREKELMGKTNIELKAMLKGEVNISRLKKKELVMKIMSIEKSKLIG